MTGTNWAMKGELMLSCNCIVFCPCVLSAEICKLDWRGT